MIFRNILIGIGCGAFLIACSGGANAPQTTGSQNPGSGLPSTASAECRGYELDVFPNGRSNATEREVEIPVPAQGEAKVSVDQGAAK